MTKNSILKIFAVLFLTVVMFSCNKENSVIDETVKEETVNQNEPDFAKKTLTQVVADAMQNPEFRAMLKIEAMKQFDGDYDVLYSRLENNELKSTEKTLKSYLEDAYNKSSLKSSNNSLDDLASQIENFQISVPVNCDKWDVENYIPLVTYIPENFDEKTWKEITCWDANGKETVLSLENEPDMPVVVLGSCERMDYIPSSSMSETVIETINSKGTRIDGANEVLYQLNFKNLSSYETWVQGGPELKCFVFKSDGGTQIGYFEARDIKRSEVNNPTWKTYYFPLVRWYWSSYGDYLLLKWQEDDNNTEVSVTFGISLAIPLGETTGLTLTPSVSVTIKFSNADDDLGTYTTHKDNPEYEIQGNSNFQFKLTNY